MKTVAFIDGANLYTTAKLLDFDIDYKRLSKWMGNNGHLIRANYYTAMIDDAEKNPLRPLIDWMDYNGYSVITKPAKTMTDHNGNRRVKGNMDIEIAVDMIAAAEYADHIILFSGDGDFRRVVEIVQRKGVHVTVCSTKETSPPIISDDLRRQADTFIDIASIRNDICRTEDTKKVAA